MPLINVQNITVKFGNTTAVDDVSFSLQAGEIACLVGPSGCGKTTMLRTICGFETAKSGQIIIDNKKMLHTGWQVATEKRQIGMVFQDFALFPHLNISDNIGFGLKQLSNAEKNKRISELLKLVGLTKHQKKYPHELSGGQQQRVALARAIAPKPKLLLMDEPFSGIDIELREQLADEIKMILKQEHITALLVTHDQTEAFAVADNVGVMCDGKLLQWDTGYNLYHKPTNLFVADFIGRGALINGVIIDDSSIQTGLGIIQRQNDQSAFNIGDHVDILIRPDDIIHDDDSNKTAVVIEKKFQGANFLYYLELQDKSRVLCYAPSHHDHKINEPIGIRLELDHIVMFKKHSQLQD